MIMQETSLLKCGRFRSYGEQPSACLWLASPRVVLKSNHHLGTVVIFSPLKIHSALRGEFSNITQQGNLPDFVDSHEIKSTAIENQWPSHSVDTQYISRPLTLNCIPFGTQLLSKITGRSIDLSSFWLTRTKEKTLFRYVEHTRYQKDTRLKTVVHTNNTVVKYTLIHWHKFDHF